MAGLHWGRNALGAYALAAVLSPQALGDNWTFFTPTSGEEPPNAIQVADFNNDGQPDIVATTEFGGQGRLLLLLWTQQHQYEDVQSFLLTGHPKALATGDFNRDGNQDVAVAFAGDGPGGVSILFGDGHGHFSTGPTVSFIEHANAVPLDLIAANLANRSDRTDLAATISGGASENFVVVLLNHLLESGGFSKNYIDTTTPRPSIAAFSTFLLTDLFVASDRVARLEGLGGGDFSPPVDFWCPGTGLAVCTETEIEATGQSAELLDTGNPSRLRVGAFSEGERFLGVIDRTLPRFTALHRGPIGGFDLTTQIPLPAPPKRLFVADIGNGQLFVADNLQDAIILDDSDNVTAVFQTSSPPFFGPTQTIANQFCSTVVLAASVHVPPSPPRLPFVAVTGRRCLLAAGSDSGIGGEGGCPPLCQEH